MAERNVLAELADRLVWGFDRPSTEDLRKARRIVAELAKVTFFKAGNGKRWASLTESADALEMSRSIAEEGEKK